MSESTDATWEFSLWIPGVLQLDKGIRDAIYRAGCDDATLAITNGRCLLHFSRIGSTRRQAVESAIDNVKDAGYVSFLENIGK